MKFIATHFKQITLEIAVKHGVGAIILLSPDFGRLCEFHSMVTSSRVRHLTGVTRRGHILLGSHHMGNYIVIVVIYDYPIRGTISRVAAAVRGKRSGQRKAFALVNVPVKRGKLQRRSSTAMT